MLQWNTFCRNNLQKMWCHDLKLFFSKVLIAKVKELHNTVLQYRLH